MKNTARITTACLIEIYGLLLLGVSMRLIFIPKTPNIANILLGIIFALIGLTVNLITPIFFRPKDEDYYINDSY